jgi:hypothetical protein
VATDLRDRSRTTYVKPWFLAMVHATIGDLDAAFRYFEQSFAEGDAWTIWFGTEPKLRSIHGDPRFMALLRRMNPEMADRLSRQRHAGV